MSKKFTPQIDEKAAVKIAMTIVYQYDGSPLEQSTTILNGITIALMTLCKGVRQHATEEGSVERMVLSWMANTDKASGNHFSDYINLPPKK